MDFKKLQRTIDEFTAMRDRSAIDKEIAAIMGISGNLAGSANSVAAVLAQNQHANHKYAQMVQNHTAQINSQQLQGGMASQQFPNIGGGILDDEGDHITKAILNTFELKDKQTFEYAQATALLLSARIRASWSPNRSPHCTPKNEHIVWQIFNHNWMVDVQWVGDATGGSEEEWTKHFAKLADRISKCRENGDKQYGEEPKALGLTAQGILNAQRMLQQVGQNALYGQQHQQNQLMGGMGNVSSQSGQSQGGGPSSAGGSGAQAVLAGYSLGMGP